MAWSPFQRSNAGIIWVEQPGDYANPIPTTAATGPAGDSQTSECRRCERTYRGDASQGGERGKGGRRRGSASNCGRECESRRRVRGAEEPLIFGRSETGASSSFLLIVSDTVREAAGEARSS